MSNRIQIRRDTSSNWEFVNPILSDGEPGLEIDTNKFKFGDGTTNWSSLPYASASLGNITFDDTKIIGAIKNNDNGSIQLVPNNNPTLVDAGQYLNIYPTNNYDSPHIHIASGNGGDLVLGTDNHNVNINHDGSIEMQTWDGTNSHVWEYSTDGIIISPGNDNIFHRSVDTGLSIRGNSSGDSIYAYTYGSDGTGTGSSRLNITSNNIDIFCNYQNGGAGEQKWSFDSNGSLTVSTNGVIKGVNAKVGAEIDIINIIIGSPTKITTSVAHNLTTSDKITITGITTTTQLNNGLFYVDVVDTTSFFIFSDYELTIPNNSSTYTPYFTNENRSVVNNNATWNQGSPYNSGSFAFNGTTEFLTISDPRLAVTGDFTIEGWFKYINPSYEGIMNIGSDIIIHLDNIGQLWCQMGNGLQTNPGQVTPNTWHHVAMVCSSGITKLYLDGVSVLTGSYGSVTPSTINIGKGILGNPVNFNGYQTGIRYSNIARYNGNFSTPTQKFVSDSNTLLLLNVNKSSETYIDSGIYNLSVGNTQSILGTSTTSYYNTNGITDPTVLLDILNAAYIPGIYSIPIGATATNLTQNYSDTVTAIQPPTSGDTRFDLYFTLQNHNSFVNGDNFDFTWALPTPIFDMSNPFSNTGSINFDGTSSFLQIQNSADFAPGSGDFTVEWWQYMTAVGSDQRIFSIGTYPSSMLAVSIETSNADLFLWLNGSAIINYSVVSLLNTWAHIAVVQHSNTITLYINGTPSATGTNFSTISYNSNQYFSIGCETQNGTAPNSNTAYSGLLTNFRYVVGLAEYTSSFTPPTMPLTTNSHTKLLLLATNSSSFYYDSSMSEQVSGNGFVKKLIPSGQLLLTSGDSPEDQDSGNVEIVSGTNTWSYNFRGELVYPDSTIQSTAWPGVTTSVPSHPTSSGTPGQIASDGTYVYVCVSNNTWIRSSVDISWS